MSRSRIPGAIGALAVATLALTACQAPPAVPSSTDAAAAGSDYLACMVANSGNIQDRSFNQAVFESLEAAQEEYGVEMRETVSQSQADYETNLETMVGEGCDYIVTVGWELADATRASAEANPDITYSIVDEVVEGPNVASIVHDTAQAAFLAGYLAAGVSKTGVVGTFGGGNQPPVTVFMDGFAAGVEQYNTAKGASVRVVGWDPKTQQGSFTDDFTNTNAAQTTAQGLISQGADIIMPVAAQAGEGAAAAALAAGDVGIIWVDSDGYELLGEEYRPLLVTTVEKRMEPAILGVIGSDIDGTFTAGNNVGTLENDGVGLSSFHDWDSKIPAALKAEVEDLKAEIIAGEIVVESPSSPTGAN